MLIAAIVAAAGLSSRMGRPKPLLDIGGQTLLATIVSALRIGGATPVIVVTPPPDRVETNDVAAVSQGAGAIVVTPPYQTGDMRESIEAGIHQLDAMNVEYDGLLLCPCDTPGITPELIVQLIAASQANRGAIILPVFASKRGHPVFLPRSIVTKIKSISPGRGVKSLFADPTHRVVEVLWIQALEDINTPEDYARWRGYASS